MRGSTRTVLRISRRATGGDALPGWFTTVLYLALVWWAAAGIFALVLLWTHSYHAVTCAVIASAIAAAAWPFRPRARADETRAHGPAIAAVAIALALLAVAGISHSEHLLTDRDPAIYINTGRSIARTHALRPLVSASPFDDPRAFTSKTAGFDVYNHRLQTNFLAFLPALLALGWSAGGDTGMLALPALLGALGLLALYALGTKVVGPRWALLGPALLVLAPLQTWFARDAYTEVPLQFFALGGLWLYLQSRDGGGPVAGAIAGIVLGTVMFVRIDALAILVAIPAALVIEFFRAARLEPAARRRRRGATVTFAVAVTVTTLAGARTSQRLSPNYVSDLGSQLHQLELAFAAGVVVAFGIIVVHRVLPGIGHWISRSNLLLWIAGAATVVIAFYAFDDRPQANAPPVFSSRRAHNAFYQSASFRWFAWYLGVATLVFIVMGFIVLGVHAVRTDSPAFFVLAATVPMTVLYIARPSVAPDQLWAMRRYLPVVLPGMTIAAAAAAIWVTSTVDALWPRLRALTVVVILAAMLIPAALAGKPLIGAKMQGGALDAIHELCRVAGPDAAIAVDPGQFLGAELPQPLRGFCGVPVASITTRGTSISLTDYAARFKAAGRQLYLLTASPRTVHVEAPDSTQVAHVTIPDSAEPDRTLAHRPDRYSPRPVDMYLYRLNSE
jgi:hypothetical protein